MISEIINIYYVVYDCLSIIANCPDVDASVDELVRQKVMAKKQQNVTRKKSNKTTSNCIMHAAAAQDTLALALASSRLITITKCECVEYYVLRAICGASHASFCIAFKRRLRRRRRRRVRCLNSADATLTVLLH